MPQQQALTNTACEFAHQILNISDGINTSSKGEELIKIPSEMLLKKGDDSKKNVERYPNLQQRYSQ